VTIKLLMTWDIKEGREQEYFEFVVRDFMPGLQQMGMEPTDAWFTMYGDDPQILAAVQIPNMSSLRKLLGLKEWDELTQRLLNYVDNFDYKVVEARSGFQI
jgi:hypothetical protein